MAYVDHAFSISDEDIMMDSDSYTVHNRPPIKEITLAVALLFFGVLGIVFGIIMSINNVGGDRAHGLFFAILGALMFIPGFYYTRIAFYAYKGYKGFVGLGFEHYDGGKSKHRGGSCLGRYNQ